MAMSEEQQPDAPGPEAPLPPPAVRPEIEIGALSIGSFRTPDGIEHKAMIIEARILLPFDAEQAASVADRLRPSRIVVPKPGDSVL